MLMFLVVFLFFFYFVCFQSCGYEGQDEGPELQTQSFTLVSSYLM